MNYVPFVATTSADLALPFDREGEAPAGRWPIGEMSEAIRNAADCQSAEIALGDPSETFVVQGRATVDRTSSY